LTTPSAKSAIDRRPNARILVRGTNWIGDAVMTMPAVQRLRELMPHAHISLLCPAKLHDLWRHNPFLNEVIHELGDRQFDVAVIFPNSFRSAWECRKIPVRVGFAGHWRRKLLTHIVDEPQSERAIYKSVTVAGKTFKTKSFPVIRHQVHRYLDLISYLGGNRDLVRPKIFFAIEDLPPLTTFLTDDGRPCFGINAGAEYGPAKRWPAERFADVVRRVSEQMDCRWLILGGPGDAGIAGEIERALGAEHRVVNVAGKTTLMELCLLLRFCRVLLTNDTGPMHLAAAVDTPVVAIFGSTSSELTGPLGRHVRVVHEDVECSPCFLRECPIDFRCMNRITVEQVAEAVLTLWQQTKQSRGRL
jgi:heptosyltransferase-2